MVALARHVLQGAGDADHLLAVHLGLGCAAHPARSATLDVELELAVQPHAVPDQHLDASPDVFTRIRGEEACHQTGPGRLLRPDPEDPMRLRRPEQRLRLHVQLPASHADDPQRIRKEAGIVQATSGAMLNGCFIVSIG